MIRIFLSTGAIAIVSTLIGALAGGTLAGISGAELGALAGGVMGLAIGFRYNADMAAIATARREMDESHSLQAHTKGRRRKRDPFAQATRLVFLRNKRGEATASAVADD